jgi:hypothetical protein
MTFLSELQLLSKLKFFDAWETRKVPITIFFLLDNFLLFFHGLKKNRECVDLTTLWLWHPWTNKMKLKKMAKSIFCLTLAILVSTGKMTSHVFLALLLLRNDKSVQATLLLCGFNNIPWISKAVLNHRSTETRINLSADLYNIFPAKSRPFLTGWSVSFIYQNNVSYLGRYCTIILSESLVIFG